MQKPHFSILPSLVVEFWQGKCWLSAAYSWDNSMPMLIVEIISGQKLGLNLCTFSIREERWPNVYWAWEGKDRPTNHPQYLAGECSAIIHISSFAHFPGFTMKDSTVECRGLPTYGPLGRPATKNYMSFIYMFLLCACCVVLYTTYVHVVQVFVWCGTEITRLLYNTPTAYTSFLQVL